MPRTNSDFYVKPSQRIPPKKIKVRKKYEYKVRRCTICTHEQRDEIEFLVKKNIPLMEIALKYHMTLGNTRMNFYNKLRSHIKKKHPPLLKDPTPIDPSNPQQEVVEEVNFKDYAKKLLKSAMNEDMFKTTKISHNHVIAAQRAIIEESKVKTQENALKFAMVKFLRGEGVPVDEQKLIESDTD